MVEMVVALGLVALVIIAGFNFAVKTQNRSVRAIRNAKVHSETNQFIQRLRIQVGNAITFPRAASTMLGSFPQTLDGCDAHGDFDRYHVRFVPPGESYPIIAHGLVPLPGKRKADIDTGDHLTYVDPSIPLAEDAPESDALRVSFLAQDTLPVFLDSDVAAGSISLTVETGQETELQKINVGDYIVLADSTKRELLRVTNKSSNVITFDPDVSMWNNTLTNNFDHSTGFIHKAHVITYAHDPETKMIYQDLHRFDDNFNVVAQTFGGSGQRVAYWEGVARNVEHFTFEYSYEDRNDERKIKQSRTVKAFLPSMDSIDEATETVTCLNQIGYPYFRSVTAEVDALAPKMSETTETGEANKEVSLTQKLSPANLRRPLGAASAENFGYDPFEIYTATPTPLAPTATPTRPPCPPGQICGICLPKTPGCTYEPPTPTPTPLPTSPPGGGY